MQIKKNDLNKIFILFLFVHLFIWTLIPSISNNNLPLDTIEALAWGSDLNWGYNKHPPFSAWSTEVFYKIFAARVATLDLSPFRSVMCPAIACVLNFSTAYAKPFVVSSICMLSICSMSPVKTIFEFLSLK